MSRTVFIASRAGDELTGVVKSFENQGFTVVAAEQGVDILKMLKASKIFSAILLNSSLETINSLDVCKEIQQNKRLATSPIFILEDGEVNRQEFKNFGVKGFFQRPLSMTIILEAISPYQGKRDANINTISKTKILFVVFTIVIALGILWYFIFQYMDWSKP